MFHLTGDNSDMEATKVAKILIDENKVFVYLALGASGAREAKLDGEGSVFPYFNKIEEQNHRLFVTGKSGSGKSYTIGKVLDQLISTKPKLSEQDIADDTFIGVVIFSSVSTDPPLDRIRRGLPPLRIDLSSPELFALTPADFKDCIVVFDDIEKYHNKKVVQFMLTFRANIFETGRHYNIDVISVSHLALSGVINNTVKSEATGVFLFPMYNQKHQSEEFLKKYVGLKEEEIQKIITLNSRWVYVSMNAPTYVVYEKGIYLV